jgi:hypothetical protein
MLRGCTFSCDTVTNTVSTALERWTVGGNTAVSCSMLRPAAAAIPAAAATSCSLSHLAPYGPMKAAITAATSRCIKHVASSPTPALLLQAAAAATRHHAFASAPTAATAARWLRQMLLVIPLHGAAAAAAATQYSCCCCCCCTELLQPGAATARHRALATMAAAATAARCRCCWCRPSQHRLST